ncbi:MAG: hypothetical protein K2N92_00005 [Malacoplasma sp.]|nr:hypothetical protein [Malacoplasma sp.]
MKIKKLLTSTIFTLPLLVTPFSLFINKSENKISLVKNELNTNQINDSRDYVEEASAVYDTSIKNFRNYIVSYSDKNIYPVNVIFNSNQTKNNSDDKQNLKPGGAQIGMTTNMQTITCTSYSGMLLWSSKLTENKLIKNYYNEIKKIDDINSFKVINYIYLEEKQILFVLFGEKVENKNNEENEVSENSISLQNLVVFGLDVKSGSVFVPTNGDLANDEIISSVNDDSAFIFLNSANQLIVTSANTVADINRTTKILSFDESGKGFSVIKDALKDNSDSNPFYSRVSGTNANDMLLGIVPSNVPGVNYALWLSSVNFNDARVYFNYYIDSRNITVHSKNINGSFDYYVVQIDNDFNNIKNINGEALPYIANNKASNHHTRGYFTKSPNQPPKFDDVYKRFYNTGFNAAKNVEFLAIYIDSYDPLVSSFSHYWFFVNEKKGSGVAKMIINSTTNDTLYGPSKENYQPFIDKNIQINTWDINSMGYDKTSNLFYYSFSGYYKGVYTYFNNYRYIKLVNANTTGNNPIVVRSEYTVESRPYTITNVSSLTYENNNKSYLVKNYINDKDNKVELLSRETNKNSIYEKTENSNISFLSIANNIENMKLQISKSNFLKNKMASSYSEQEIRNIVLEKLDLGTDYNIQIKNIIANDEIGTISFSINIIASNKLGTNDENSESIYSLDAILIDGGYKLDDLVLVFKNDEAVNDIKQKYDIDSIIENDDKDFIIKNFLQDVSFLNQPITITNQMINLKKVNDTSIEITLSIPIKDSENGDGILPVGFPKDKAIKKIIYNGFLTTNNEFPSQDENDWSTVIVFNSVEIAGIIIGLLILTTILISSIIFIKIKPNSKYKKIQIRK